MIIIIKVGDYFLMHVIIFNANLLVSKTIEHTEFFWLRKKMPRKGIEPFTSMIFDLKRQNSLVIELPVLTAGERNTLK